MSHTYFVLYQNVNHWSPTLDNKGWHYYTISLETDEYYNCAQKESNTHGEYHTKEWDEGDFEDGSYYSHFDFTEWMEYEHDEEKVIEFIYDNYELEILPKPELQ